MQSCFCIGPVLLWRQVFLIWTDIWTLLYGKKHYAWIVPWTSLQLFVPRLNDKSIPGLWIEQKPPFSSSLSPIAIVFTWLGTNKKEEKKKTEKTILRTSINGNSHDIRLNKLAMSLPCRTGPQIEKQAKSLLTPCASRQCSPTGQVVHHCTPRSSLRVAPFCKQT